MDEIQVELNELRKLKKQNANASKSSSNIRKLFQYLANDISSLSERLLKDNRSGLMSDFLLFFFFFLLELFFFLV